ncbi:MAG: PAS-domain containing protein [Alphaproteobacteria bacterium]|nr:PAS-domain containing protein [Alphaproteobacteria bacterium]
MPIHRLAPQAAILGLATVLAVAMLVLSLWSSWRTTLAEQHERVVQFGQALAVHIQDDLAATERAIEDLAGMVVEDRALLAIPRGRLHARVNALARASADHRGFGVMNPGGVVVAASALEPSGAGTVAERDFFRLHRDGGVAADATYFSAPFKARSSGRDVFAITRAIRDPQDGSFLGVVGAIIPLSALTADLDGLRGSVGADVGVFHRDGFALAAGPGDARFALATAPGPSAGVSPLSGRDAVSMTIALQGHPVLVVASRNVDAIASEWFGRMERQFVIYGAILTLVVALNIGLFLLIRRHAELARRTESSLEDRFRDGIESMNDGIAFWDRDRKLATFNRRYVELLPHLKGVIRRGISLRELTDIAIRARMPDMPDHEVAALVDMRVDDRHRNGTTYEIRLPGGRVIEVVDHPMSDGGFIAVLRDATEARRAAEKLAASEAHFRAGIESMDDGFALWDADDRLVAWNRRFLDSSPIMAEMLREGVHFSDCLDHLARRRREGEVGWAGEDFLDSRRDRRNRLGEVTTITNDRGRVIEIVDRATADGGIVTIHRDVTDLHAALRQVEASEARFRDGIECMGEGFMLWDRDDRLIAWNGRMAQLTPTMARVLRRGLLFSDYIDNLASKTGVLPGDPGEVADYIARRRDRRNRFGEPFESEFLPGRVLMLVERETTDGGVVTIARDVSEERRAIRLLERSEAQFRDGIESMGEVFMLWDAEDRLIAWNQRITALGPITAGLLRVGLPFAEYIDVLEAEVLKTASDPVGVRGYYQRRRERRLRLGEPFESGLLDGRLLSGVERATSDGGIVTVIRDVTQERRAARRLAASEAQFRDFGEIASDWFWETDRDHRYVYYSRGTGSLVFEPEKILGRTRIELVEATGLEATPALRELQAIMDRHEAFRGFAIESRHWHTGAPCVLEVSGKPLFDDEGAFRGYRGTGRDITALRRQEKELERALAAEREMNQQQRRFVSIASHEFRTPLAVIDGATQRIMAKIGGANADVAKRLERIRGAVARMTEIIDRTLSSARMDEGRIEFDPRPFALGRLLQEVCGRQRQISPGFEIALDAPSDPLTIDGDPRLLDQVMTNLLSNAVKYSGRARRVDVVVRADGDGVEISVRDHGVGVPADEVSKLFTRFYRASTATGISGTGIGLHLVKELVELHGGRVDCTSRLGEGSSFVVRLPRHRAAAERAAE